MRDAWNAQREAALAERVSMESSAQAVVDAHRAHREAVLAHYTLIGARLEAESTDYETTEADRLAKEERDKTVSTINRAYIRAVLDLLPKPSRIDDGTEYHRKLDQFITSDPNLVNVLALSVIWRSGQAYYPVGLTQNKKSVLLAISDEPSFPLGADPLSRKKPTPSLYRFDKSEQDLISYGAGLRILSRSVRSLDSRSAGLLRKTHLAPVAPELLSEKELLQIWDKAARTYIMQQSRLRDFTGSRCTIGMHTKPGDNWAKVIAAVNGTTMNDYQVPYHLGVLADRVGQTGRYDVLQAWRTQKLQEVYGAVSDSEAVARKIFQVDK